VLRAIAHRIVAHPAVYDRVQAAAGAAAVRQRLAPFLADATGPLLDIGGGTGLAAEIVPPAAQHVVLDPDPRKREGVRRTGRSELVVAGDGTRLPFAARSIDTALCVAVAHHLDDDQARALFREAARVTARRFVFHDPVVTHRLTSKVLWHFDRGSHPRPWYVLEEWMERYFTVEHVERYTIHHTYVLLVGRPKG
jgi:SAM-dependent methyltransferase